MWWYFLFRIDDAWNGFTGFVGDTWDNFVHGVGEGVGGAVVGSVVGAIGK